MPNQSVVDYLRLIPDPVINLIDVGCHKGFYLKQFRAMGIGKTVRTIGIDPLNYDVQGYDRYYEAAITDELNEEQAFYEYEDAECSSLHEMDIPRITHDPAEYDSKWYVTRDVEKLVSKRMVKTRRLSQIILENALSAVHFLKIDAQGHDMNVVRSLGDQLSKVQFIQLESAASSNKEVLLYKGQHRLADDVAEMDRLGFAVAAIRDHAKRSRLGPKVSPEADILFYNRSLKQADKLSQD